MIGARPQLGPRGAGEAGRVAGGECGGARRAPLFAGRRGLRRAVVACDIGLLISSARARARSAPSRPMRVADQGPEFCLPVP